MTSADRSPSGTHAEPLLSYIVLSYNYRDHIQTTLRSILAQTVQNMEIVVVDDNSTDDSADVVRSFADPRIRLLINEKNVGGAASYNRAVQAARGLWLVNLDADDWINPRKAEIQLDWATAHADVDIIGSYVSVHDEHGNHHPDAESFESFVNQPLNLNLVDTWIGKNHLCRSSTMVRATAHHRIGLDDLDMVRAPDYELWTRGLHAGLRIGVVPLPLTCMRAHTRGVTRADPLGSFLEMSYAALRNLVPACDARALHPSFSRVVSWVADHDQLSVLMPAQQYRLLGMFMRRVPIERYSQFKTLLDDQSQWPELAEIGLHTLALISRGAHPFQELSKLRSDAKAFIEARDFWHAQSLAWEEACQQLTTASSHRCEPAVRPDEHAAASRAMGIKQRTRAWFGKSLR